VGGIKGNPAGRRNHAPSRHRNRSGREAAAPRGALYRDAYSLILRP
jgi:hypothetical protein